MKAAARTKPPPGFKWGPSVDGTRTVVAKAAFLEATKLRFTFIDGPALKFTLRYAWKIHDRILAVLAKR